MSTITESIGRVLAGRYRIESALGSGASANVFAAFDTTLQRRVAVKVLHPALAADSAFLRRFRSEAQSAAALTHAHVLAVYDWGEDDQGPFLVLEYLGGGSLRDMLDRGTRLSVAQAVSVGVQAADGLAYAHGRGFVHRDVKPANLLFDAERRLRVADFGLARALSEAALTEPSGATVGTARYAAPEQALGQRIDGRADVYALALVLYESVTGEVPFAADTTVSTLMARIDTPIPEHEALGPLFALLAEAAAPDPGQRLDAATLATRLRRLAGELPAPDALPLAGAGPVPAVEVLPARRAQADLTEHGMGAPPPPAAPARRAGRGGEDPDVLAFAAAVGLTDEEAAPPRRRRRWPWVTALVLLVAAGAGVGVDLALTRAKLLTPSHRLPSVTGLTTARADAALRRDRFHVVVSGRRTSITAPTGVILTQSPRPRTSLKEGSAVSVVVSSGLPTEAVPDLTAVTGDCPAIAGLLAQANLQAACTDVHSTTVAKGKVIDWSPRTTALYHSSVTVTVSAGPPIVAVPALTGQTCQGATTTLQAVGLVATPCTQEYNATVQSGLVVSWTPTGQVPQGTSVAIVVSEGPQPVTIPPGLYGMTVSEAIGALQALDLNPVSGGGSLSGHVFLSTPAAGTSVLPGSNVTIYSK